MPRVERYPPIPLPKGMGGKQESPGQTACMQGSPTIPGTAISMEHPCLQGPRPSLPGPLTGKWRLLGNSSLALG